VQLCITRPQSEKSSFPTAEPPESMSTLALNLSAPVKEIIGSSNVTCGS